MTTPTGYRYITTSEAGMTTIGDTEIAAHLIFDNLDGDFEGYEIQFDAANTFTVKRMYRLSNETAYPITVENSTGSITAVILPGNCLHCFLSDITTGAAGNWKFRQFCYAVGEEDPS
jgi:hypothetical protein